ncbi:MAG: hypothetical protein MK324_16790 [Pirellulales bacterium]|nr:hypothetical protein [Pirellulales bacterium]
MTFAIKYSSGSGIAKENRCIEVIEIEQGGQDFGCCNEYASVGGALQEVIASL